MIKRQRFIDHMKLRPANPKKETKKKSTLLHHSSISRLSEQHYCYDNRTHSRWATMSRQRFNQCFGAFWEALNAVV